MSHVNYIDYDGLPFRSGLYVWAKNTTSTDMRWKGIIVRVDHSDTSNAVDTVITDWEPSHESMIIGRATKNVRMYLAVLRRVDSLEKFKKRRALLMPSDLFNANFKEVINER